MKLRHRNKLYGTVDATCSIDGIEHDVLVEYRISPAEPDVNFPGEIELNGIYYEDEGDITNRLSDKEYDDLLDLITDSVQEDQSAQYYDRADYYYDRMKDDKLTGDA